MAELVPAPLEHLIARLLGEWKARRALFDLPERSFWRPPEGLDLSVRFHGHRASTPAGPAAGPQSQMAQNIALSFLAGARIIELKTVQLNDRLQIPRPCIDARNVGFNVEWSQELRLAASFSEYVHGWVLVALLRGLGLPSPEAAAQGDTLFDLSVGYDLAGISSDPMRRYLRGLCEARAPLEAARSALPAAYRDLPLDPAIARSVTLSTFHGCPADEIEKICEFLLSEIGVHTVVKMNPTLLGFEDVQHLLHDVLGYRHIRLDRTAFDHDLQFAEAVQMVRRLERLAARRRLGFGVKFSNTLVVRNHDTYFRDPVMYLSGPPLHVLASTLALRFRDAVGSEIPISFSAGIDPQNFPDAVAMGFVPITSCTDLLRPGGYARMAKYLDALAVRMRQVGTTRIDDFIRRTAGDTQSVSEAAHRNSRTVVAALHEDPRYRWEKNRGAPKKIGSALHLFDCISCDKCVPVCPNDANFVYETRPREVRLDELCLERGELRLRPGPKVQVTGAHQIGNFADFCNECGNCDVFCPEDGGPFIEKPRFFGSLGSLRADARSLGFYLERADGRDRLHGRMGGRCYLLEVDRQRRIARFTDGVLAAHLSADTGALWRAATLPGAPDGHVLPLGPAREMLALLQGIVDPRRPTPVHTGRGMQ
jgi:putative selenate reductase